MLNTAKLRNVYKRHDVLHTCFNGFLIGPADLDASDIEPGQQVRVEPVVRAGGLVFEVYTPAGAKETWQVVKVPKDGRKATKRRLGRVIEAESEKDESESAE